jgi:diguanylate cyclase (GGDEF)-like protein
MIWSTIKNKEKIEFARVAFDDLSTVEEIYTNMTKLSKETVDYLVSGEDKDVAKFNAHRWRIDTAIKKWTYAIEKSLQIGVHNDNEHLKNAENLKRNYALALESSLKVLALSEAGNNEESLRYLKSTVVPYRDKVFRSIESARMDEMNEVRETMSRITASFGMMPWIIQEGIEMVKLANGALTYMVALTDVESNINMQVEKAMYYIVTGSHDELNDFRNRGLLVEQSFERLIDAIEFQQEAGVEGEEGDLENTHKMQKIYTRALTEINQSIALYDKNKTLESYEVIEERVEPLLDGYLAELIHEAIEDAKEEFTDTESGMIQMINNATILYIGILTFIALFIITIYSRLVKSISSSITSLKSGTENISIGKLDHRITIKTGDEFENLADSFNKMADDLQEYRNNLQHTVNELETRNAELKDTNNELEVAHYDVSSHTEMLSDLTTQLSEEVAERKKQEERIAKMAYYDSLTKLPNRTLFETRLKQALSMNERTVNLSALMFIDVDNFKRINDTLGHSYGDKLLIEIAERLNGTIRKSDMVMSNCEDNVIARLGGDEFTLLLSVIKNRKDAGLVAIRIKEALSKPVIIDNYELFANLSIGIAIFPDDGKDMETLLKNADTAMYHTKEHGKNGFSYYSESMGNTSMTKMTFEGDLRKALEREEFILHYQPIVNSATGKIAGLEALIRWQHPEKGTISPLEFIPAAEQSGLIVPLSNWVIMSSLKQSMSWKKEGINNIPVSVNLTSHQFHQQHFADDLTRMIEESGLNPEDLHVEITESTLLENTEIVVTNLNKISSMGFHLVLDDFGTGYSSLSYLKRLPIHTIKIDRSFVMDINTEHDAAAISHAIISMAQSLGLKVIAEGVENEEQMKLLKSQGCHELQGFLFSRPLPAEEVTPLLLSEEEGAGVLCKI